MTYIRARERTGAGDRLGMSVNGAVSPGPRQWTARPTAEIVREAEWSWHDVAIHMDILMITPEARPFAKTGGLADVAGALPLALARLGHRVTLVLPKYRGVEVPGAAGEEAGIPFGRNVYPVTFFTQAVADGVTAVLIGAPDLYDRDGLYGSAAGDYADNAFRYAVLSRGALEYVRLRGARPSVVHAHDWQAALAPVYLKTVLAGDSVLGGVRTVLTIHNLAFQGMFAAEVLPWIGLPPDLYHAGALEFWGRASALKGGIVFSDAVTTVSPTYAKEIATPEFGFGFDGIIASRRPDVIGILNGIDTDTWNPASDPYVPAHFSARNLAGKADAKRALLEYARLPTDAATLKRPVIGLVSRLTYQKGFDLIAAAADRLMAFDASWVMLGSGEPWCETLWRDLAQRYPDRVSATIGFDETLSHLIEAGSDVFLMPSRYEPCGLNQMYSLRYGTLPIVRATGGLDDTVVDADSDPRRGTGFKFVEYRPDALVDAVKRALAAFRAPRRWQAIQRRAMGKDHSWDVSAREYVKVYVGPNREETNGIRKGSDADRRQLRPDRKRRDAGSR
jgi:starch synthase